MKENKTTAKQRLYGIARYLCAGLFINVACLCFQVSFYFPAVPVIVALVAIVLLTGGATCGKISSARLFLCVSSPCDCWSLASFHTWLLRHHDERAFRSDGQGRRPDCDS